MGRMVASDIPELADLASAKGALAKLWRARQFGEAAALASKAVNLWPQDAEFRTQHAQSLLAAGALIEAEAAAREALLLLPESEDLWIVLADSLIRRERKHETVDSLAEACGILPRSLALLGRLGRQAQRLGKHQQAIQAFSAAAKLEPEKEFWVLQLLNVLWAARRTDQAFMTIKEGLQRFPESAFLYCQLAKYFAHERQHLEAENAARRALEYNPEITEAHAALCSALMAQQRFGEAFSGLQAACEAFPKDPSLWLLLGRQARRRSVLDLAINAYERAVALPGAPASAWVGLVNALLAKRRHADAADQAARAVLALPANHGLSVLMAEALLRNGDAIESVRTKLAEALGAGPNSTTVSHPIMEALLTLERADEVLLFANARTDEQASSPETRLRFAKALMSKGVADQAEAELRCLVEEAPDWIPALDSLCEALRQQKKIKEALAIFRRIEALGPDRGVISDLRYRMFGTAE
jgi:tetratricopeptide (TPR) repeat protein